MSTINLGFTSGELTSVDATVPWYASYFLNGNYELSTGEGPGHYLVSVKPEGAAQHWRTEIDTASFQSLYSTEHLLVFTPVSGAATPEIGTWAMLLMGFGCLAYAGLRKVYANSKEVYPGCGRHFEECDCWTCSLDKRAKRAKVEISG